jgi:hypothetical protein
MYKKEFPRELEDAVAGDPCIPVDEYSFIWTSTNIVYVCRYIDEEDQGMKKVEDQRLKKTKDET